MQKLQKNMILLCSLLFVGQICHASFITRLSGFSLATGAALTKRAYDHSTYKEADSIDAQIFPHSLAWYKDLAIKYPEAHLDQKKFKSGIIWAADMAHHIIYAPFYDLITIEQVPENDTEVQAKIEKLAGFEGIVLHEAGHIEHNHHVKSLFFMLGTLIPLEICYQDYMKKVAQAPSAKNFYGSLWNLTKSMPRRIGLFTAMSTVGSLVMLYNSRQDEMQADAFVCKHADLAALRGYAQLFEKNIPFESNILKESPLTHQKFVEMTSTHPSSASRLIAVQKEIARRELALVK